MTLENPKTRPLTRDDIEKGKEFTIAQVTTVTRKDDRLGMDPLDLRVGDVIKIVKDGGSEFLITLNGRNVKFVVPKSEVGDLIVASEE